MSEAQEPKRPKPPIEPGQPLPRLWKTEPDPEEEEELRRQEAELAEKKAAEQRKAAASKPTTKKKSTAAKDRAKDGQKTGKKVLLEETPTFDTIESRQHARMIMGGLVAACVLIFGWITYRTFLYDPIPFDVPTEDPTMTLGPPEPRLSPDQQAHHLFGRAHEFAKKGQTDEAVKMLKTIVKTYKGTQTAGEAKAALDRPGQNLPLFPDRPVVIAQTTPPVSPPRPSQSPPAVPAPVIPVVANQGPVAQLPAGPVPTAPAPPVAPAPGSPGAQSAAPGTVQSALSPVDSPAQPQPMPTPTPADTMAKADPTRATITPAAISQRTLPAGFKAKLEAGIHESGWPLVIVGERDDAPMLLVPGGTFTMGNDHGDPDEAPPHPVQLSTYYIDQHEVTYRQFRIFLDETRHRGQPPGRWLTDDKSRSEPASAPIVLVNHHDAETFAIWALKRLPTEAQWEMAARSSDGRRYPWGDQPAKWSRPRAFRQVDPVMSFPEDISPFGVFDLAGNAQEWTRDWFDSRYYELFKGRTAENPTGPEKRPRSLQKVVKGGSKNWSASAREGIPVDRRLPYLGFRCVLSVEGPDAPASIGVAIPTTKSAQPSNPQGANPAGGDVPF